MLDWVASCVALLTKVPQLMDKSDSNLQIWDYIQTHKSLPGLWPLNIFKDERCFVPGVSTHLEVRNNRMSTFIKASLN